jgi:hypothetical protein
MESRENSISIPAFPSEGSSEFGIGLPAIDRFSDLQAAIVSYSPLLPGPSEDQCITTAFVPAHRCGTVPDSHRIPYIDSARRLARTKQELQSRFFGAHNCFV